MDLLHIALSAYVVTTIFALAMTYKEQKQSGHVTPVFALIGACSCIIWPLVGAFMAFWQWTTARNVSRF
ncbi:hypothetical protein [Thalassovita mediterranea]|jgi:hypothetical protein|uniref:Uncharacterized protein n=1 Tax=Thalassovita mediterranea TaxID=340021 RepID=A0A0P1GRK3_9RHOB|nr:hypothetical protein [Thalassovita mediterranea]MCG7573025.1 hypothetical protein [Phaeobacter sp. CNT1-3]CUH85108.1 hypothetical protein TM5383_02335 [Thalassovita mediterranea]SIS35251.1 hypothetical protein SAMN05421685_11471 [Thalassovita mediterranea]